MTCWQQLDIPEYSDIRTIKRAYAKQLKVTKPDEDPEGFKILHDAYQLALSLAKSNQIKVPIDEDLLDSLHHQEGTETKAQSESYDLDAVTSSTVIVIDDHNSIEDTELYESFAENHDAEESLHPQLSAEVADSMDNIEAQYQDLIKQAQLLYGSDQVNQHELWSEIFNNDLLIDLQLFQRWSQEIFEMIERDWQFNNYWFEHQTILFFDQHFNWSAQLEKLESFCSDESIRQFKQRIKPTSFTDQVWWKSDSRKYYAWKAPSIETLYNAYIIELLIILVTVLPTGIVLLRQDFLVHSVIVTFYLVTLFWVLLLSAFLECSSLQASIGSVIMGLRLIQANGLSLKNSQIAIKYLASVIVITLVYGSLFGFNLLSFLETTYLKGVLAVALIAIPIWAVVIAHKVCYAMSIRIAVRKTLE